jgi:hypothetical protein
MKLKRFLSTALPACVALVQILSPGAGVAQDTDYAYFKKWRVPHPVDWTPDRSI